VILVREDGELCLKDRLVTTSTCLQLADMIYMVRGDLTLAHGAMSGRLDVMAKRAPDAHSGHGSI